MGQSLILIYGDSPWQKQVAIIPPEQLIVSIAAKLKKNILQITNAISRNASVMYSVTDYSSK